MMQPATEQEITQEGAAAQCQPVVEMPSPGSDQQQEKPERTREEAEGPRFQMPNMGSVQQVVQGGVEGQTSQERAPQRIQSLHASPMVGYGMGSVQGWSVPSVMTAAYGSPAVMYPYQAPAGQAAYQEFPISYKQGTAIQQMPASYQQAPAAQQMPASYQQVPAAQQMPASYQQAPIPAQFQEAQASQQLPVSYQDVQQMPATYQLSHAAQQKPALYQQAPIPAQYQQAQATRQLPFSYQNVQQMPASYQQTLATQQIPTSYQQATKTQQIPTSYQQVVSAGTVPQMAAQPLLATMQASPALTPPTSFQASSSGTSSGLSWGMQISPPQTLHATLQTSAVVQGTEQETALVESTEEEGALDAQAGAKTPEQRRRGGFFGRFCGSA